MINRFLGTLFSLGMFIKQGVILMEIVNKIE